MREPVCNRFPNVWLITAAYPKRLGWGYKPRPAGFELLASDLDSQTLIERLELRFTKTPTLKKIERNVPRKKTSYRRRLNHVKRKQKIDF